MTAARALPIFMYHHVCPAPGLVTMTPENFRAQMRWLAGHGYRTIGCDDLARFLAGAALPAKSVMLSFDDGYLDNYVHAHPVLAEFGLHAVLFVITGRIGDGPARNCVGSGVSGNAADSAGAVPPAPTFVNQAVAGTTTLPPTPSHRDCAAAIEAGRADDVMLRWSEIERMRAAGTFEFHSHSHTHTRWDRNEADPTTRHAKLGEDLALSRAVLQEKLGGVSSHLCWPQGYHDAGYRATARAAGFSHLYTVSRGTCQPRTSSEEIPRIAVKDQGGFWLGSRAWLYGRPGLSRLYDKLR